MSDNFFLQNKAMPVSAMAAKKAIVLNVGPGLLYYKNSPLVSSTNSAGTISPGSTHTFVSNTWVTASEARVVIAYSPELETDMATQTELEEFVGTGGSGGGFNLSGNGPPTSDIGEDGDFYIDLDAPEIYGPKTDGAWPAPIQLGTDLLSGSGPPDDEDDGEDGNFYVDTLNAFLYGPKANGAWPTDPIALGSGAGAVGQAGGVLTGAYPNPSFAVDMATQAELDAVEDELEDIVGVPVLAGTVEPTDTDGTDGSWFFDTSAGRLYGPKSAGAWDTDNPILLNGIPALTGITEPTGGVGGDGDFYFQTNTSTIFGPKDEGEWPDGISFKGEQGDPGGTMVWKGVWADDVEYDEFDQVSAGGSTWVSVDDVNEDNDPTTDDGTWWSLASAKGNQGEVGDGFLPGLMLPAGTPRGPLITSAGAAAGTNIARFAHMNPVPQDGTLTDIAVFVGASSGNMKLLIYDTGDTTPTVYTKIYESSATAVGSASAWQTVTGVGLSVTGGDRLVFGVVCDNATAAFGRGDVSVTGANTLPVAFAPPLGACRIKLGATYAVTYASPAATMTETNMAVATYIPMIIGQVTP